MDIFIQHEIGDKVFSSVRSPAEVPQSDLASLARRRHLRKTDRIQRAL